MTPRERAYLTMRVAEHRLYATVLTGEMSQINSAMADAYEDCLLEFEREFPETECSTWNKKEITIHD